MKKYELLSKEDAYKKMYSKDIEWQSDEWWEYFTQYFHGKTGWQMVSEFETAIWVGIKK
jgi:hypothetical protein